MQYHVLLHFQNSLLAIRTFLRIGEFLLCLILVDLLKLQILYNRNFVFFLSVDSSAAVFEYNLVTALSKWPRTIPSGMFSPSVLHPSTFKSQIRKISVSSVLFP